MIPYHDTGIEIQVFPTMITNQFMQDGDTDVFPWRRDAKPYQPPVDTLDSDEAMKYSNKHKGVEEYEPEEVVSKGKDEDGTWYVEPSGPVHQDLEPV